MEIILQHFNNSEVQTHREELQRFVHSLKEEKLTFSLDYEQILGAEELCVGVDDSGHWCGLGGYRLKWGIGIFFLVIHRDMQNKGLGKQLTSEILANFPRKKILLLSVSRSNTAARRLYDGLGFKTINRTSQYVIMGLNRDYFPIVKPLLKVVLGLKNMGR